jgi:cytolysin (calcineurin-like family phosphatase)
MVKDIWKRLSGPLKIGLFFGGLAIVMAVAGLIKGSATAPLTARSLRPGEAWSKRAKRERIECSQKSACHI